jgi:hypothetical protein
MTSLQYWIAIGINSLFLYTAFRLAIKTNLIKDDSILSAKPFSFGKSQLFWWTIIIVSVFIWSSIANNGSLPKLNTLCLALLGISAGTTAVASLIDNTDKNNPAIIRHQDTHLYSNFLRDILSDAQGNYSIHRFQSFIFNLAVGIIFLYKFFYDQKWEFPTFEDDKYILGLLGISNLGYAGLKLNENTARKDKAAGIDMNATDAQKIQQLR